MDPRGDFMKRVSLKEWMDEGRSLFGPDMLKWKFICPSCGNVQTPEDFRPFKNKGAQPDSARFNCIGRYDGHMEVDMCSGKSPCNYTSGGLLNISPVKITDEQGREYTSFDFLRSP